MLDEMTLAAMRWDVDGLMPAIAQDANTGNVLMMAYMNAQSLQRTLETGQAVFWSRRRQELWRKGATSGNTQRVIEIRIDCDADTLLLLVEPAGPACHTNAETCFFRSLDDFAAAPQRL
ncbi:MAG: phosphoribosyl-AMP cyclohydrolase [Chloroflexi bacterium]|nr:phosphoribosyl-AMP cyclohydrolase [Chloroflexota bacterium]